MSNDMYHEVDAKVKRVTQRALLLEIDGEDFWIPKSAIADYTNPKGRSEDYDYTVGQSGIFDIAEWKLSEIGIM